MFQPQSTVSVRTIGSVLTRLGVLSILLTPMVCIAADTEVDNSESITSAGYPIAGIHPEKRPTGAHVIKQMTKDNAWYGQALHGLSAPYPSSFQFLEDQGNWFNPFTQPGMTGPYDIRGWHKP